MSERSRATLISGCSSGIGRATALHLARSGFTVLAGVRDPADGEELVRASEGDLHPVIVDLSDEDSIGVAAERAGALLGDRGLTALVNNAGIAVTGPLELVPLEDFRHQLEVNLIGQLALTRALLPRLRRAPSPRLVNVSSIGGLVATPFYGPYCASKFALEALSDCLRVELRPWGIETVVIEPGSIATAIWDRGQSIFEGIRTRMPADAEALYGEAIVAIERISRETGERGIEPQAVARAIHRAITVRRPRARYRVGRDADGMVAAKRLLPPRTFDRIVARNLKLP